MLFPWFMRKIRLYQKPKSKLWAKSGTSPSRYFLWANKHLHFPIWVSLIYFTPLRPSLRNPLLSFNTKRFQGWLSWRYKHSSSQFTYGSLPLLKISRQRLKKDVIDMEDYMIPCFHFVRLKVTANFHRVNNFSSSLFNVSLGPIWYAE